MEKHEESYVRTSGVDEKQLHDISVEEDTQAPPPEYMGSAADQEDMLMLGRRQVLRVRRPRFRSRLLGLRC